jgi:hypothetical protein
LKDHFFPHEIRLKIWKRAINDNSRIDEKLYENYYKAVENVIDRIPNKAYIEKQLSLHTQKQSKDSQKIYEVCLNVLLTFQMFRTDILFREGMQKIVVFIYKLTSNEFQTFKMFHNIIINSPMFKGYYKGRYKKMKEQSMVLDRMIAARKKNKDLVRLYELYGNLFKKFFFMMSTTFFLDIFEPQVVEKIMDHFVIFGESTLYGIGIFVIEQIVGMCLEIDKNTEIDDLVSICRLMENVVIIQKLLYLDEYRTLYDATLKSVREGK